MLLHVCRLLPSVVTLVCCSVVDCIDSGSFGRFASIFMTLLETGITSRPSLSLLTVSWCHLTSLLREDSRQLRESCKSLGSDAFHEQAIVIPPSLGDCYM